MGSLRAVAACAALLAVRRVGAIFASSNSVFEFVARPQPGVAIADVHLCSIVAEEAAKATTGSKTIDGNVMALQMVTRLEEVAPASTSSPGADLSGHDIKGNVTLVDNAGTVLMSVTVSQVHFVGLDTELVSETCEGQGTPVPPTFYLTPRVGVIALLAIALVFCGFAFVRKGKEATTREAILEEDPPEEKRLVTELSQASTLASTPGSSKRDVNVGVNKREQSGYGVRQMSLQSGSTPSMHAHTHVPWAAPRVFVQPSPVFSSALHDICACGTAFVPDTPYCLGCGMDRVSRLAGKVYDSPLMSRGNTSNDVVTVTSTILENSPY